MHSQNHTPVRRATLAALFLAVGAACADFGFERRDEHGMTPLMRAARAGNGAEVERLIADGARVNARVPTRDFREFVALMSLMQQLPTSDIGYTPLMYAASEGHADVVRTLLAHGADARYATRDGVTALDLAIRRSDVAVMKQLVAAGARVTPRQFGAAVAGASPEAIRFLLANGADVKAAPARDSQQVAAAPPPLAIVAANRGDPEVLELLIAAGVDVHATDRNGWSALRWARRSPPNTSPERSARVIQLLERAGANDVAGERADALFDAVRRKDASAVRLALRAGADPNARDQRGVPPLSYAALGAPHEIVEALVDAGADVNANPRHESTPLVAAVRAGNISSVRKLLGAGARVDEADHLGQTPLQVASSWQHTEIMKLLLGSSASAEPQALSLAAFGGNLEQMRLLLDHGADANASNADALSEAARGCLRKGNTEAIRMLLAAGADPKRTGGDYGYTALHQAAATCDAEVVRLLLQHGADPNRRDGNGFTPLIGAASAGKLENVRLLIAAGADVNARDVDKKSVLAYAEGHPAVREELIRAGAR